MPALARTRLLALAVVAVLAAACGGESPQELLDRAPEALEDAGTSRFEMEVEAVGEGVDSTFAATGEQDLTAGTLRMETDLGMAATTTETVVTEDAIYLRSPLFEMFTGDPDRWVAVDLEEAGESAGLELDQLVEGNTGPAALVQQLRGAAGEVEELDTASVRGVDTHHLRVTVDTDRAIEQSPPEAREQLRTFAEASGLPAQYPMEVWIDDDALVRRVRTIVEVEDETAGPVTQQTTLELFDFGVAVDIEPPGPDETVDMRELLDDLAALEEGLDEDGLDLDIDDVDPGDPGVDDLDADDIAPDDDLDADDVAPDADPDADDIAPDDVDPGQDG